MTPGGRGFEIVPLDLHDTFFDHLEVRVRSVADFDVMPDLQAVSVNFTRGTDTHATTFVQGGDSAAAFRVPLPDPRLDEYTLETEYRFDPALGTGDTVVRVGPVASRQRVAVVGPGADLQYTVIDLLPSVQWTDVTRAEVEIVARSDQDGRELARDRVVLDSSESETQWRHRRRAGDPAHFLARTTWEDVSGRRHVGPVERLIGGSYVVRGGFADRLLVKVAAPLDWSTFLQAIIELEYRDHAYVARTTEMFDVTNSVARDVDIPILDPAKRTYRWRSTLVRIDGTTNESPWIESDQRIVTAHDAKAMAPVTVTWLGGSGGALRLRVDFRVARQPHEFRTSILLRPGDEQMIVLLPITAGRPLSYRYEVRRITEQGSRMVSSGTGTSDLLVVRAR